MEIPVYSHESYDVVPNKTQMIRQPHIVIIEGLNVLQTGHGGKGAPPLTFVSDYFDFSIYVDADERYIRQWYVDRFLTFQRTVFQNKESYFHRYAKLNKARPRKPRFRSGNPSTRSIFETTYCPRANAPI